MLSLTNKVALLTGASRGIGAAAAHALADAGASVVLTARSEDALQGLAAEIAAKGGRATAVRCDVSRYEDMAAAVATCEREYGRLDILVNNAGVIDPIGHLADLDHEPWAQVIDINVKGVFHGMHAALPIMVRQGGGVIVNISSGAATSPIEGWSHYCASKAAALMLTRCADKEYADKGVRVVGLSPGTVATDMQVAIKASGINPVSQLDPAVHIPPEWVGRAIVWLCTDEAADLAGDDFRLREPASRARVGLPEVWPPAG